MQFSIDSSVLLYAVGADHAFKRPCQEFLACARDLGYPLHVAGDFFQEVAHHRIRVGDRTGAVALATRSMVAFHAHWCNEATMAAAIELMKTTSLIGRDAVHAATALACGSTHLVTQDSRLVSVPGLTAVDAGAATVLMTG